MIVRQIWTGNAYRNFNYLIACEETGEALAIDPLDHEKCLNMARHEGWDITQIVNTHEHHDHIDGNRPVMEATGARVLAHHAAGKSIPEMSIGLSAGDIVKIGNTVEFETLDTPGHTMSHVCLLSHTETPGLFCGDTLFNAGAGNCHNGGHPAELYETFAEQLMKLSDDTMIYPGHDYLHNNLQFTLDREPSNAKAKFFLDNTFDQDPAQAMITSMALEKQINTFFRLHNPEVIEQLILKYPEIGPKPDPKTVFLKLRELRNSW